MRTAAARPSGWRPGRRRSTGFGHGTAAAGRATPPSFSLTHDAARGFHYNTDPVTGRVSFTVVLLVRVAQRRMLVDTFSSTTGNLDTKTVGAQGVARCLPVSSPGIHAGASFYWMSRRKGRVVRYDVARGRASVLREPPKAAWAGRWVPPAAGSECARSTSSTKRART